MSIPHSDANGAFEAPEGWTHPAERPVEPEHPMALMADSFGGDPEVMLECVIQEYARLGHGTEQLIAMCRDPFFQAIYGLRELFGDEGLERRIRDIVGRCGVLRFSVSVVAAPALPDTTTAEAAGPCGSDCNCDSDPFDDPHAPVLLCDEPAPAVCGTCELATLCVAGSSSEHGGENHA